MENLRNIESRADVSRSADIMVAIKNKAAPILLALTTALSGCNVVGNYMDERRADIRRPGCQTMANGESPSEDFRLFLTRMMVMDHVRAECSQVYGVEVSEGCAAKSILSVAEGRWNLTDSLVMDAQGHVDEPCESHR